jgi:hypothetical protein
LLLQLAAVVVDHTPEVVTLVAQAAVLHIIHLQTLLEHQVKEIMGDKDQLQQLMPLVVEAVVQVQSVRQAIPQ